MNNYHFFWGGPLSNWSNHSFHYQGAKYSNVEQWMMAKKALLFKDEETHSKIMSETNPKTIKILGKAVKNFDGVLWDSFKFDIVLLGCLEKHAQNVEIQDFVRNLGPVMPVEASPYDRVWGIGFDERTALDNIPKWGENLLGKIWNRIRLWYIS